MSIRPRCQDYVGSGERWVVHIALALSLLLLLPRLAFRLPLLTLCLLALLAPALPKPPQHVGHARALKLENKLVILPGRTEKGESTSPETESS